MSVSGRGSISYDNLGNPTSYFGKSMTWTRGSLLSQYGTSSYTYDCSGIRVQKTANGRTHKYFLEGDRIVREEIYSGSSLQTTMLFMYGPDGVTGYIKNGTPYVYEKNLQGDIIAIKNVNGDLSYAYEYDEWGNVKNDVSYDENPFRYRGYYYDSDTGLYYCGSRYYDPSTGRFISPDDISFLAPTQPSGLNLYAYCGNNPVMYTDNTGYSPTPWWQWAISGMQLAAGIGLCFVPGAQGVGAGLIAGGALGLISNVVSPAISQSIGGVGSIANGWGAFSTGMSILGVGLPGLIGGIGLMLVGGATMAFGANEIATAVTGTNYIQKWTGMSDSAYGWTYLGLNLASSVGQIAGRTYHLNATKQVRLGYDGQPNGYRYQDMRGRLLYDFDYPHGNIHYNHFHGIPGGNLANRTSGHMNYFELIWSLFKR